MTAAVVPDSELREPSVDLSIIRRFCERFPGLQDRLCDELQADLRIST